MPISASHMQSIHISSSTDAIQCLSRCEDMPSTKLSTSKKPKSFLNFSFKGRTVTHNKTYLDGGSMSYVEKRVRQEIHAGSF